MEQAERDVAFDGEPGKDAALLKDKDAPRIGTAHHFAIDPYFSAGGRKKTGHGAQQRRFAAARRSEQTDKLSIGNFAG